MNEDTSLAAEILTEEEVYDESEGKMPKDCKDCKDCSDCQCCIELPGD